MQAINRAVVPSLFLAVFVVTAGLSLALAIAACFAPLGSSVRLALLAGALLYLLGAFGVTMAFNVPRNNALAGLDPEG